MTALEVGVERLRHVYGAEEEAVVALDDLTFRLPAGSTTAIMGPSGSGKSTLTTILAGLQRPTSGRVLIGDADLAALSEVELMRLRARELAVTVQRPDRNLLGYGTVLDNVRFAQRGVARADRGRLPAPLEVLREVGIAHLVDQRADGLSGGERQRLALAVGLATAPRVLLADEPTSQLDDRNRDALVDLLCGLRGRITVIVVTHDDRLGERFDRRIVLADGRAVG
ncbi:MAG TPA: ATP-binding cassette domain-containing protein [Amnibacterium sp.]|jgi:ABC-type lipoprotein export system ATPase subunit|nr:ATP-binding cassette domain-containing protein [Amnibacterium sp.]